MESCSNPLMMGTDAAARTKNNGLIYEKFLNSSLKKFIEYHRKDYSFCQMLQFQL